MILHVLFTRLFTLNDPNLFRFVGEYKEDKQKPRRRNCNTRRVQYISRSVNNGEDNNVECGRATGKNTFFWLKKFLIS